MTHETATRTDRPATDRRSVLLSARDRLDRREDELRRKLRDLEWIDDADRRETELRRIKLDKSEISDRRAELDKAVALWNREADRERRITE